MTSRSPRSAYYVTVGAYATAAELSRPFASRADAAAYLTTLRRAGFLPAVDMAQLTITHVTSAR